MTGLGEGLQDDIPGHSLLQRAASMYFSSSVLSTGLVHRFFRLGTRLWALLNCVREWGKGVVGCTVCVPFL